MTPEKVLEILKAHGTHVTIEEAKIILIYLTQLAEAEVSEYIKNGFFPPMTNKFNHLAMIS